MTRTETVAFIVVQSMPAHWLAMASLCLKGETDLRWATWPIPQPCFFLFTGSRAQVKMCDIALSVEPAAPKAMQGCAWAQCQHVKVDSCVVAFSRSPSWVATDDFYPAGREKYRLSFSNQLPGTGCLHDACRRQLLKACTTAAKFT